VRVEAPRTGGEQAFAAEAITDGKPVLDILA
jgi:hypothetical protein